MGQFFSAIPQIVLYGCVVLATVSVAMYIILRVQIARVAAPMKALEQALARPDAGTTTERRNGLSLERLDSLRGQCEKLPDEPQKWWGILDSHIEHYSSPDDIEGWFLTETPRHTLPFEVVIGRRFHSAIFAAFPGLLTGAGLTLTFIAILWAIRRRLPRDSMNSPRTGLHDRGILPIEVLVVARAVGRAHLL
jgi:hypothetical protein